MIYLVDRSAWEQLRYSKSAREKLAHISRLGELAICPVIAGEMLYSARDHTELMDLRRRLEDLLWLQTSDEAAHRMLGVQRDLAKRGQHRSVGLPDLLVAATAETNWATLLHYNAKFERIAEVTGQPHEWIVPRGKGHARAK